MIYKTNGKLFVIHTVPKENDADPQGKGDRAQHVGREKYECDI